MAVVSGIGVGSRTEEDARSDSEGMRRDVVSRMGLENRGMIP